jgi:hypothetical protein
MRGWQQHKLDEPFRFCLDLLLGMRCGASPKFCQFLAQIGPFLLRNPMAEAFRATSSITMMVCLSLAEKAR